MILQVLGNTPLFLKKQHLFFWLCAGQSLGEFSRKKKAIF